MDMAGVTDAELRNGCPSSQVQHGEKAIITTLGVPMASV